MGLFDFFSKQPETVSANLPYQELYPDGTVLTKDYSLLKCYRAVYSDVMMSNIKADEVSEKISSMFHRHAVGQKELPHAFYFLTYRVPTGLSFDPEVTGQVNMQDADLEIEKHRMNMFSDEKVNLVNINYVCVKVQVAENNGIISDFSRRQADEICAELENAMRTTGATLIPLTINGEAQDNILAFLKFSCTMELKKFSCPEAGMSNVSNFISTKAIDKGKPMLIGDNYVQVMTLNDFPSATYSCILSSLLNLPFPFKWCTRWIPETNRESQLTAKKYKKMFDNTTKSIKSIMYEERTGRESQNINVQARSDSRAVEEVMDDLAKGETIGQLTSTITIFDKDLDAIYKKINAVHEQANNTQFDLIVEGPLSNFAAWKSALPGDTASGRRRPIVTASNFSHIVPFTGIYHGYEKNEYMEHISGCSFSHAIGKLITGERYNLNLNGHIDDTGHTFIIGSSGSGKSVFLAFLASQWARYPESRVILFDKGGSFANITRRTKGAIYYPGAEDSSLQFMPLARIKTRPDIVVSWLTTAIEAAGTKVDSKTSGEISEIVDNWDSSVPTLERFINKLRGTHRDSLALPALEMIQNNKILNHLFGGTEDTFNKDSFTKKTMIEMERLMNMGDIAIYPTLEFLFSRIDELVENNKRHPTLLILDEAWVFLNNERFRAKITEWLKVLRKNRCFVIMATQEISDLKDPKHLEQILSTCHTKIFLPNSTLREDGSESIKDIYRSVGLTDAEILIIGLAERKQDYFIKQDEGSALVNFGMDSYQLERLARDGY